MPDNELRRDSGRDDSEGPSYTGPSPDAPGNRWFDTLDPKDIGEIIDRINAPESGILRILDDLVIALSFKNYNLQVWQKFRAEHKRTWGVEPSITDPGFQAIVADMIFRPLDEVTRRWHSIREEYE